MLSKFFFPIFLPLSFLYLLNASSLMLLRDLSFSSILVDESSLFITFMTVFVLYIS